MYLAIIDDHSQIKIARTSDDLEISELFKKIVFETFSTWKIKYLRNQFARKRKRVSSTSRRMKSRKRLQIWIPKKAFGPDQISNTILKNLSKLSTLHLVVFQTCINKASLPFQWEVNKVTPIYKENEKADISQYRPISLLTNVSKVIERVVFQHWYPIIEAQLEKRQFGFRQKRSTILRLLLYLKEVNEL